MVALITGGSRGLGRSLGEQLADLGWRVVLVARGAAQLKEVVEVIRARGGSAWGIQADVAEVEGARLCGEAAVLAGGPVDLLILNASSLGPTPLRELLDTDPADLAAVLQTNLIGPFRLARAALGSMSLRGKGTVVFVSSDAAVQAYPRWGAYGVSKAAADHLARIWHSELPDLNITSFDPGEMDTAMHAAAMPDADPSTLADPADAARRLLDEVLR